MNKNGHLFITKSVTVELLAKYRFWIKLGSIAPDLLFHTYLRGHTWDTTFDRNSIHMERLWEHGHMNRWSCFKLGYLLHYVEDYFTYPHSKDFPGMLLAHVIYERDLTAYLQCEKTSFDCINGMDMHSASIDMLFMYLQVLHDDYLRQKKGLETDTKYIMKAANAFVQCFIGAFERKEQEKQKLPQPVMIPQLQTIEGMIGVVGSQIEQAANYMYVNR